MLSLEYLAGLKKWADSCNLPVHMDGARVFNAAATLDVPVSEIAQHVTTIQFCLSKVIIHLPQALMVHSPPMQAQNAHVSRVHSIITCSLDCCSCNSSKQKVGKRMLTRISLCNKNASGLCLIAQAPGRVLTANFRCLILKSLPLWSGWWQAGVCSA